MDIEDTSRTVRDYIWAFGVSVLIPFLADVGLSIFLLLSGIKPVLFSGIFDSRFIRHISTVILSIGTVIFVVRISPGQWRDRILPTSIATVTVIAALFIMSAFWGLPVWF